MQLGIPSSADARISFIPAGPVNDGPDWYQYDKNNFAPRVSFAWSLNPKTRRVIRGGYFLVYDRIGSGLATQFNTAGSFGLASVLTAPSTRTTKPTRPSASRAINVIPATYPGAPPASFPATPPQFSGTITSAIDQNLRTPYSHAYNLTFSRDLGRNYAVDVAYVGRQGRNLLIRRDAAMPANFVEQKSGMDYFTAAVCSSEAARRRGRKMWLPSRTGRTCSRRGRGGMTATQVMAGRFMANDPDWMTALWDADQGCDPACPSTGEFSFFNQQYDSLAVQSSMARSGYNSMQLALRRRLSRRVPVRLQLHLRRREGPWIVGGARNELRQQRRRPGGYSGFLINSWDPDQQYSYADFDVRHQINVNGLNELPFGQGKKWATNANGFTNALIGDWSIAGYLPLDERVPVQRAELPFVLGDELEPAGQRRARDPNKLPETRRPAMRWAASQAHGRTRPRRSSFQRATLGRSGVRNIFRGDGYFGIDTSIGKALTACRTRLHRLMSFLWDVFNLTNTVRFDIGDRRDGPSGPRFNVRPLQRHARGLRRLGREPLHAAQPALRILRRQRRESARISEPKRAVATCHRPFYAYGHRTKRLFVAENER